MAIAQFSKTNSPKWRLLRFLLHVANELACAVAFLVTGRLYRAPRRRRTYRAAPLPPPVSRVQ